MTTVLRVRVVAAAALGALLAGRGFALAQEASPPPALAIALEEALVHAIERAEASVVSIMRINLGPDSGTARLGREPFIIGGDRVARGTLGLDPSDPDFVPNEMGAGVVVDPRGLVLTNFHVVRETTSDSNEQNLLYVTLPGRDGYYASIWAADPTSDLAVLRLAPRDGRPLPSLTPIPMGDGSAVKKGQIVLALGNPYNIAHDGSPSASWGIISNVARKHWPDAVPSETGTEKRDLHKYGTLIQTDARLNLGTSGGALVNLHGEMIGLTTSLAAIAGYEQSAGYAIPLSDPIQRIIHTLIEGREVEYGFLGITLDDGRFTGQSLLEDPQSGVIVRDVYAGTPAERAGLQPRDLIVSMGGNPVRGRDDLMLAAATQVLGKATPVVVLRSDRRLALNVELTKFPVEPGVIASVRREAWRGIHVDHPTSRADVLRDPSRSQTLRQGCVLVTAVDSGSPAADSGVEELDLITHVAGKRVRTPDEFDAAVQSLSGAVDLGLAKLAGTDSAAVRIPAE